MNTCNQCGEELEREGASFCSECGAPVTDGGVIASEKDAEKDPITVDHPPEDGAADSGRRPGSDINTSDTKKTPAQDEADACQEAEDDAPDDGAGGDADHPAHAKPGISDGEESPPEDEGAEKYKDAVEDAWEDGVLDEEDRQKLDSYRDELDLPESKAADMEQEARKAVTAGGHDPDNLDLSVVGIEINDSRFYMEKRSAVLDFKFVNNSDRRISRVKLSVKSAKFEQGEKSCTVSLRPEQPRFHQLAILPSVAGEHLMDLTLCYCFDGVERVYTAQQTFQVLDESITPRNLTLHIDQSLKAGGDIGYGNSVRNQVKEDIHKGVIKTVNDLITRKYEPNWQRITLYLDESVAAVSGPVRPVHEPDPDDEKIDRACLMAGPLHTAVVSSQDIKIGRNRHDNDIKLRVLPRNKQNDRYTLKISRTHIVLRLDRDGLKLADNDTAMGTTVNDREIDGEALLSLKKPSRIGVAGVLTLKITPLVAGGGAVSKRSRYKALGRPDPLWKLAERHGLRAVKIERMENLADRECYVIVFRWMNIGADPDSEFLLPETGVPMFRLLRFGERFWLESISDSAEINGDEIEPGEAVALETDMEIRAGAARAQFCTFSQCS